MSDLSRYRAQKGDDPHGPSDLQWLEDGINFMGAWMKDTLFPGKEETSEDVMIIEAPANKSGKLSRRKRNSNRKRRIIRARERTIEIIED